MTITRTPFGTLPDGRPVEAIRLSGEQIDATILTWGATLQALDVPDWNGTMGDVVLGHDDLASYVATRRFFGATIGRYANRIAGGRFELAGETVVVPANDGVHALHGGATGFDQHVWNVAAVSDAPHPSVTLTHTSPHGENGFPGTVEASVTYALTGSGVLSIQFSATTDRTTVVSLTNHSYFNLGGALGGGDILGDLLTVDAGAFLAIDPNAIPLLQPPMPVDDTPFDFRRARKIGGRIREPNSQLRNGHGYDHNFCLSEGIGVRFAARVESPRSGRVMELFTDRPGLQVYSGNYLDGTATGKGGWQYRQSDALCLEPQAWPDTPNRPDFGSAVLNPGDTYSHHSIYRFSAA